MVRNTLKYPITYEEKISAMLRAIKHESEDESIGGIDGVALIMAMNDVKLLKEIDDALQDGQGDDEGDQILPDFDPGSSTLAKVIECLHLLEKRRDVISGFKSKLVDSQDES